MAARVRIFSGRKLKRELRRSPGNKTLIRWIDAFSRVHELENARGVALQGRGRDGGMARVGACRG